MTPEPLILPPLTAERREFLRDFARYLSASSIAFRMGIGLAYALKNYTKPDTVGDYWFEVANALQVEHMEIMNKIAERTEVVPPPPKPPPEPDIH